MVGLSHIQGVSHDTLRTEIWNFKKLIFFFSTERYIQIYSTILILLNDRFVN